MKQKIRLTFFLLFLASISTAQFIGDSGRPFTRIDIPFEYINGFIVLEVTFNYIFPLRFILDTGAEHTILTKREYADLLGIPFEREFRIIGSDMSQDLKAYLIRNNHLQIGNLALPSQSMVVMDEDYFRFEEYTGINIHGIIGSNIFRHFVVRIDYQRKILTLTRPIDFSPPRGFTKIPIEIFKNKAYLNAQIAFPDTNLVGLKLLVDTGAGLTLILHNGTNPEINPPEGVISGNIGKGLGGYLEGYVGRSESVTLGPYALNGVVTNYQDLNPEMDTSALNNRNGIIGNLLLGRFTVIIDYFRSEMYLRPNKYFDEAFNYDRSGMGVIASGNRLGTFTVSSILYHSPAGEAGILPGDEILFLNGLRAKYLGLSGITRKLSRKSGKTIRVTIRRKEEKMKVRFILRDLI
ncbi:MAG: aspartyl protease family protein [Saprospiraceae bacterium]|nr:aspartyl protease family protein [Saprospiraceae bacterium]